MYDFLLSCAKVESFNWEIVLKAFKYTSEIVNNNKIWIDTYVTCEGQCITWCFITLVSGLFWLFPALFLQHMETAVTGLWVRRPRLFSTNIKTSLWLLLVNGGSRWGCVVCEGKCFAPPNILYHDLWVSMKKSRRNDQRLKQYKSVLAGRVY